MNTLVNVTTADRYAPPATLICPDTIQLDLVVANAAVLWQVGRGSPPAWDEPEAVIAPSLAGLDLSCDAVRFRSLAAGKPAQVSATAWTAGDVAGARAGG